MIAILASPLTSGARFWDAARHHAHDEHGLSSADRWPDRACQSHLGGDAAQLASTSQQTDWDEHLAAARDGDQQRQAGVDRLLAVLPELRSGGAVAARPGLRAARPSNNPEAAERIRELRADLARAKDGIRAAQERQSRYADQHRRAVTFIVGDRVLLSTEHLKLKGAGRTPKLTYKYLGPFRVSRVVDANAYELDLPSTLGIHPVLNMSRLKPYRRRLHLASRPSAAAPSSATRDRRGRWRRGVRSQGDHRQARSGARLQYLVEWVGYPSWEATWESSSSLVGARDAIAEFESRS